MKMNWTLDNGITKLGRMFRALCLGILISIAALVPQSSSQGLLEDIDPFAKTRKVIEAMEASLTRLIEEFGDTLDEQTLLALQRATAGLQSAKLAAEDLMEETFEDISDERKAVIADAHALIGRIEGILEARTGDFAEIEQRFSRTLEQVARVTAEPWVLAYHPLVFIPSLGGDIRIRIDGKHLDHPNNRLLVADQEFAPSASLANRVDFTVPRNLLVAGENGYASFRLRLHHDETSGWLFKTTETIDREVTLDLRSAGGTLGNYIVETLVRTPASWSTKEIRIAKTSPVNIEHCLTPEEGGSFDPAYTEIDLIQSGLHQAAHEQTLRIPDVGTFGLGMRAIRRHVPEAWLNGPTTAALISLNTPERICVTFNLPPNPAAHIDRTEVAVDLVYRQRSPGGEENYSRKGVISWSGGDVTEVLPDNYQGFRATVRFSAGGNDAPRVFTREESYKFLSVLFDSASRTLTFRPLPE